MGMIPAGFASFITTLESPFVVDVSSHALYRFKIRKPPAVGNSFTWS